MSLRTLHFREKVSSHGMFTSENCTRGGWFSRKPALAEICTREKNCLFLTAVIACHVFVRAVNRRIQNFLRVTWTHAFLRFMGKGFWFSPKTPVSWKTTRQSKFSTYYRCLLARDEID